jgi:GWxTD domain-containing protein
MEPKIDPRLIMKYISSLLLIIILSFTPFTGIKSQARTTYQALNIANNSPSFFMDHIHLPYDEENTLVSIVFRINYEYLTFRRISTIDADSPLERYESEIQIVFDFYDKDTPVVPDRPFIARETWSTKVIANSYKETQSNQLYITGKQTVVLKPDSYNMIPTIIVNGQEVSGIAQRAAINQRTRSMNRRDRERYNELMNRSLINVPDFSADTTSYIILLERHEYPNPPQLLNLARNVNYAQDFNVMFGMNKRIQADSITVMLTDNGANPINSQRNQIVWQYKITSDDIWVDDNIKLERSDKGIVVINSSEHNNHTTYLLNIPNHQFRNAWHSLTFRAWNDGTSVGLGSTQYLSRWFDIPSSLLNLDVAIDNLKFILESDKIREMKRGNAEEKEQKFRAFWAEKDPTPDTDFNELMTEYYNRIDYAYRTFTTPSRPGHDSDQGRIYVTYGPPDSIERRFPPNGATQEVWEYGSRTFIFTATSGFGDFQLVTSSN